jgi:hypothetical protein
VLKRLTTEIFIQRAKEIHKNKYDYSKVNYINNRIKVEIICPKHGVFLQGTSAHLLGKGCILCGRQNRYRKTTEQFIEEVKRKHGDKYDYSKVEYINNLTKVKIICPIHGEFLQTPIIHLKPAGCFKCTKNIPTTKKFMDMANVVHNGKYDYSKTVYISAKTKISIICLIHGEFFQSPSKHTSGQGCVKCAGFKKLTTREFIKKSQAKHRDKYDYSQVNYTNAHVKVKITCPVHGEFRQEPRAHVNGAGCGKCSSSRSKKANRWLDDLGIKKREIYIKLRSSRKYYIVDGFDFNNNTVYEFFGDFWHGSPLVFNPDAVNPKSKMKFGELYKDTIDRVSNLICDGYDVIYKWETDHNMGVGKKYEKQSI